MNKVELLIDQFPDEEWLIADGFDDAIIGICGDKVVYDKVRCIDILIEQGLEGIDALDHFSYNVEGSYVGDKTPLFVTLLE